MKNLSASNKRTSTRILHPTFCCVGGGPPCKSPSADSPCCSSCWLLPSPTRTPASLGWAAAGRWRTPPSLLWSPWNLNQRRTIGYHDVFDMSFFVFWPRVQQTFAVVSVEERHVNDCGLLPFSLEHIEVLRPVFLLQDFVINLWKRLLHCGCIVTGKGQRLCRDWLQNIHCIY